VNLEFQKAITEILSMNLLHSGDEKCRVHDRRLAFAFVLRHIAARESDGRGTRQSGQILTEAATTNSLRVVRLLSYAKWHAANGAGANLRIEYNFPSTINAAACNVRRYA
jgi:hypothetical protein